ncbi:MAG: hypothetical protein ACJAVY_001527, partial [Marinoscillum sp.]
MIAIKVATEITIRSNFFNISLIWQYDHSIPPNELKKFIKE